MAQQIKILIACHKSYPVPDGPCYLPVEVGAALHQMPIPGFTPDDTGDNISEKNKSYCELTALYWAWKNLDADVIGLVHYRRYFAGTRCLRRLYQQTQEQYQEMAQTIVDQAQERMLENEQRMYGWGA